MNGLPLKDFILNNIQALGNIVNTELQLKSLTHSLLLYADGVGNLSHGHNRFPLYSHVPNSSPSIILNFKLLEFFLVLVII